MRHAKSDWDDPALDDFDRPLNPRGRASATAIGGWLIKGGYLPDQVLCSSAKRTKETWGLVKAELGAEPMVEFKKELYLASPDVMFQEVAKVRGAQSVLLVAHNPGSAILANALAQQTPPHARFGDYPTAATTVFEFSVGDWALVKPGTGRVIDFVVPRALI